MNSLLKAGLVHDNPKIIKRNKPHKKYPCQCTDRSINEKQEHFQNPVECLRSRFSTGLNIFI